MNTRRAPAAVVLCVAGLLLVGCADRASEVARATPGSDAAGASPSSRSPARHGKSAATDADFAAVKDVLEERGRAITAGDAADFMKTVDLGSPSFLAGQRTYFENLQLLPVRSVTYDMTSYALTPVNVTSADQLLRPDVSEHVFLPGTDDQPTAFDVAYTFARRGDRWLLAADSSGPSGDKSAAGSRPWAGGPIEVEQRGPLLVVMDRSDASRVPGLADELESDIRSVSDFLNVPVSTNLLVDATTTGETSRVDQLATGDAGAAAAVTYPVGDGEGIAGWRIKINPTKVSEVLGQPGLLRHELTHFVLRDINIGNPTWLVEGIAELSGYWPAQFDDQVVTDDYYKQLMAADRALPQTPYWSNDPAVNYQVARAAVDYLVLTYGVDKLVRFMRAYGDLPPGTTEDVHTRPLLKKFYGTTEPEVVAGAFRLLAQFKH